MTPVAFTISSLNEPAAAVPVVAVTVRVVPEPLTPVILAPVPPTSEKFDVATPVTDAANVTVQLTDVLIQAGLVEARLIELTVVPAAVLVRLKLTPVVTPRALAATV